ncbi:PspC domain-containing protein [Halobacillus salinarum]|uniref:PspC domain-containing protein n=1 Tax=Halobacillus salinarum TaxID=2932257 RepID=A0ABY4EM15_9BACI|nr:PspC domain-containing protein [Halobacillus salinarum]UOQ45121.1 PspC domain-containing protein [Halobacillus salinarum]
MKKLYKSTSNHQLTGVLGGISELYNLDASLLRIIFVLSVIVTSGFTLLVYIAAAIIMPTDKEL